MDMKLESFISGAFMGGSMSIAGGALGFVVAQSKLYSESKDVAKASTKARPFVISPHL